MILLLIFRRTFRHTRVTKHESTAIIQKINTKTGFYFFYFSFSYGRMMVYRVQKNARELRFPARQKIIRNVYLQHSRVATRKNVFGLNSMPVEVLLHRHTHRISENASSIRLYVFFALNSTRFIVQYDAIKRHIDEKRMNTQVQLKQVVLLLIDGSEPKCSVRTFLDSSGRSEECIDFATKLFCFPKTLLRALEMLRSLRTYLKRQVPGPRWCFEAFFEVSIIFFFFCNDAETKKFKPSKQLRMMI